MTHLICEKPKYPTAYPTSDLAPAVMWLNHAQWGFACDNFNEIRTEFNRVVDGGVQHRLCFISNHTDYMFIDFFENLNAMAGFCQHPIRISFALQIMMEKISRRATSRAFRLLPHFFPPHKLRSPFTFQIMKNNFGSALDGDSTNRFRDGSPLNLLRNLMDKQRPNLKHRMGDSWKYVVMPVALIIRIAHYSPRHTQTLPVVVGSFRTSFRLAGLGAPDDHDDADNE